MRSQMSYRAKRELLLQIAPRYREASSALKEVILDEFVAATGYVRKYAIRLLNHPAEQKLTITVHVPHTTAQKSSKPYISHGQSPTTSVPSDLFPFYPRLWHPWSSMDICS
jgi:hypothetical protein